jgi:dTDP-4-dehydrorhamnose reductase
MEPSRVLFTGGSGLLGGEVRKLLPGACYPTSAEFNVTDYAQMEAFVRGRGFEVLVHAAAFTSPPRVDKDPARAIEVNIAGTANVARLCLAHAMKLVYISTDYVFRGDRGNYREDDALHPVNAYAWSKLGGECAARLVPGSLIVRTTFGPNVFPYEKAFVDQWTSREPVRIIAWKLVEVLTRDVAGVIHLGGPRRTVYEYAQSLDASRPIKELSIRDVSFAVPVDTSLDTQQYERMMAESRGT